MKRSVISALVAAGLLAACGSSDDADSAPDTTTGVTESAPAATAAPATEAVATTDAPTTTEAAESTTPEPESTEAEPESTEPEADGDSNGGELSVDERAAADAWAIVFDSTAEFGDKQVHLADAAALQPTLEAYTTAGSGFGGISLVPTAVVVDGATAEITYDVNFGENPAYEDQAGSIGLVDGVWIVDREEFCAFMSSARVSCP